MAADYLWQDNSFFLLGGDVNHDRTVNVADLGTLATNFGKSSGATWSQGDFNYDGTVNVADLGTLATNFGLTLAAGSADAAFAAPAAVFAKADLIVATPPVTEAARSSAVVAPWPFDTNVWGQNRIRRNELLAAIGLD
jgi:hypothetical protein